MNQRDNVDQNGFSATLFQDLIGKKTLAIRGTEIGLGLGSTVDDLILADLLGIGVTGFANFQAVELIRYWKELTTASGSVVTYSSADIIHIYEITFAEKHTNRCNSFAFRLRRRGGFSAFTASQLFGALSRSSIRPRN